MSSPGRTSWNPDKTRRLVFLAIWSAIIIFLAFTPNIGYINLFAISATTVHIPVIIGAIMLGPVDGAFLGLVFGITSLVQAPLQSGLPSAFLFSPFVSHSFNSVLIAIIPRVLIGIVAAYVFRLLNKFDKTQVFAGLIAGITGSLTNTIFVMGGAALLFGQQTAQLLGVKTYQIIYGILVIVGPGGLVEAALAGVIGSAVAKALIVVMKRSSARRRVKNKI